MKSLHLIIDASTPDFTLYIHGKIPSHFRKIGMKSIIITQELTKIEKNIYVHCDVLNKDDNLYNGEQSDILAIVAQNRYLTKKCVITTFDNCSYKNIKSPDFTSIRMLLTHQNNLPFETSGRLAVTYELEFIE